MNWSASTQCSAFLGYTLLGQGSLSDVIPLCQPHADSPAEPLLIFKDADSSQIEVDFRGSLQEVLARLPTSSAISSNAEAETVADEKPRVSRGRPKLGVVAREVTLLPRHWEWLRSQPGGASVALRKLVEKASRENAQQDRKRSLQETAYRFMSVMAASLEGFEEASRALFSADGDKFSRETASWPADVRTHARRLAGEVFYEAQQD